MKKRKGPQCDIQFSLNRKKFDLLGAISKSMKKMTPDEKARVRAALKRQFGLATTSSKPN